MATRYHITLPDTERAHGAGEFAFAHHRIDAADEQPAAMAGAEQPDRIRDAVGAAGHGDDGLGARRGGVVGACHLIGEGQETAEQAEDERRQECGEQESRAQNAPCPPGAGSRGSLVMRHAAQGGLHAHGRHCHEHTIE